MNTQTLTCENSSIEASMWKEILLLIKTWSLKPKFSFCSFSKTQKHVGMIKSLSPTAATSRRFRAVVVCTDWWLIILTQSKPKKKKNGGAHKALCCLLSGETKQWFSGSELAYKKKVTSQSYWRQSCITCLCWFKQVNLESSDL